LKLPTEHLGKFVEFYFGFHEGRVNLFDSESGLMVLIKMLIIMSEPVRGSYFFRMCFANKKSVVPNTEVRKRQNDGNGQMKRPKGCYR